MQLSNAVDRKNYIAEFKRLYFSLNMVKLKRIIKLSTIKDYNLSPLPKEITLIINKLKFIQNTL